MSKTQKIHYALNLYPVLEKAVKGNSCLSDSA